LITKNIKYPMTIAAAMGKPRSATSLKNISINIFISKCIIYPQRNVSC